MHVHKPRCRVHKNMLSCVKDVWKTENKWNDAYVNWIKSCTRMCNIVWRLSKLKKAIKIKAIKIKAIQRKAKNKLLFYSLYFCSL